MRRLAVSAMFIACGAAAAEPAWLTVVGEPGNAHVDTVEVDATSAVAFESLRLVKLRVNRAQSRRGIDGKPYRSYYSTAIVDCTERQAWHRSLSLFSAPLWKGQMRMLEHAERNENSMVFASMENNPRDRLIKAACAISLPGS